MPAAHHLDRPMYHPAVDRRHEVVPLSLRQEGGGGLQIPALIGEPQEDLAPGPASGLRDQRMIDWA